MNVTKLLLSLEEKMNRRERESEKFMEIFLTLSDRKADGTVWASFYTFA